MPDLPCQHIYARLFIEVRVDYISSVGRRFIPTAPIRRFWLSAKEPIISMHCADRGGLSSYLFSFRCRRATSVLIMPVYKSDLPVLTRISHKSQAHRG